MRCTLDVVGNPLIVMGFMGYRRRVFWRVWPWRKWASSRWCSVRWDRASATSSWNPGPDPAGGADHHQPT